MATMSRHGWPNVSADGTQTWRTGRSARALDDVDRRILAELTRDGRVSVRTLPNGCTYLGPTRMRASIGWSATASSLATPRRSIRSGPGWDQCLRVADDPAEHWREVAAALNALPYVEHFALVGGDFDVLALVQARTTPLRHVVLERIQDIPARGRAPG